MPLDIGGLPSLPSSISPFTKVQEKSNVNADTLSRIPWDQYIEVGTVGAIFKAVVDGPKALMEVYTCHEGAINSLIPESPPALMTATEWAQAKRADPTIGQVITWIMAEEVDAVKVSKKTSQEVKPYLRQKGQLCLKGGVLYQCRVQTQKDHNKLKMVIPPTY